MDDLAALKTKKINPKLFWAKGNFLIAGPSGLGKTTIVETALADPSKFMDLVPGKTALWVFAGASHDLESSLRPKLDSTVFDPVHFPTESVGDCTDLKTALKNNNGKGSHCIFVDDYLTYSGRDTQFLKELTMMYKRHDKVCLIVAVHMLRLDKTSTTSILLGQVDRLLLPKSPMNLLNVETLANRRRMSDASRRTIMASVGKSERGLAVYDFHTALFIDDYYALQAGERKILAYGECHADASPARNYQFHPCRGRLRRDVRRGVLPGAEGEAPPGGGPRGQSCQRGEEVVGGRAVPLQERRRRQSADQRAQGSSVRQPARRAAPSEQRHEVRRGRPPDHQEPERSLSSSSRRRLVSEDDQGRGDRTRARGK